MPIDELDTTTRLRLGLASIDDDECDMIERRARSYEAVLAVADQSTWWRDIGLKEQVLRIAIHAISKEEVEAFSPLIQTSFAALGEDRKGDNSKENAALVAAVDALVAKRQAGTNVESEVVLPVASEPLTQRRE